MWRSQKVVTISQRGNPQQGQRQNCSAGWFPYPVSQGWVYRAEHIQELQSNPKAQGDTPAYSYYLCTRDKVGCGSRKCKSYFKAMSCVPQALLSLWKAKQEKFRWYYLMEWQFLWGTQGILDWKGPQGLSKSNFWPATGQSLRVTPRAKCIVQIFLELWQVLFSKHCPGELVHCPNTLWMKNLFLLSSPNLPWHLQAILSGPATGHQQDQGQPLLPS